MDRLPVADFEDMQPDQTYLWYRNDNDIDFAWLSADGLYLVTTEAFGKPDYWELSIGLVGVLYGPVNAETTVNPEHSSDN
ncbi:hypothetical protein [Morganella morganii]|uniref:hypothetical protein n=1 Tax=Morganella morganii TaxID=582 RepID=UPI00069B95AC|nr:hypothetical protein [Morganella morganii]KNZ82609.1 hypothetical protein AKG16_20175 [Morganella morganii]